MERQGRIHRKFVKVEEGTAQGQMMFWDNTKREWVHTETSELVWDDVNKRLGIGTSTPLSKLHVAGTSTIGRLLAGGVTP